MYLSQQCYRWYWIIGFLNPYKLCDFAMSWKMSTFSLKVKIYHISFRVYLRCTSYYRSSAVISINRFSVIVYLFVDLYAINVVRTLFLYFFPSSLQVQTRHWIYYSSTLRIQCTGGDVSMILITKGHQCSFVLCVYYCTCYHREI